MKTAIIKQIYDSHGPWRSIKWQDTSPEKIFDLWPSKSTWWWTTCLFKADWYVVPEDKKLKSDYIYDVIKNRKERVEIIKKYTKNVVLPKNIPFDDYDLVIFLNPLSDIPQSSKALFVYCVQEHWDNLYAMSLRKIFKGYDLFLDIMEVSAKELKKIPQVISFPFIYDTDTARLVSGAIEKKDAVFVEWRLLAALGMTNFWNEHSLAASERLQKLIGAPIFYKGDFNKTSMGTFDPPLFGDGLRYFKEIAACKYYLSAGRYSGPGQALCEAASLGCICIGEEDKAYHKIVCHPECLCADMLEMPYKLRKIIASPQLHEEIILWQDAALKKYFKDQPIGLLEKAIQMKKTNSIIKSY